MEIKYRQDINHNYMILNKSEDTRTPLAEKMLLHNNIPGLLHLSVQHLNGNSFYFYDIRSRQSLSILFEGRRMSYNELKNLLSGLVKTADRMSDYLLKTTDILVKPQCIFWNLETNEPVFCCYPEAEDLYTESYMELAQFIIDCVDKEDEDAVQLAYDYFNQVCDGIYSPENVIKRCTPIEEPVLGVEDNYEEALPKESLWEDEEEFTGEDPLNKKENYFDEEDEKEGSGKPFILYAIALAAILLAAGLLMKPSLLESVGISGKYVPVFGGVCAIIFASAIVGIIYIKRRGKGKYKDNTGDYEKFYDGMEEDLGQDEVEQAEYTAVRDRLEMLENSKETVLLSDYVQPSPGMGRKIRTEAARLTGNINGIEESFAIDKSPFTIGKMAGKADAVIADRRVSRIHAAIRKDGGRYFLSDLNSTNGTCLNDRRLEQDEAAALEDGDIIKFANIMLKFSL